MDNVHQVWIENLIHRAQSPHGSRLRVGCIGAGYVGGPTMAVMASECEDYDVFVADICEQRIKEWNEGDDDPFGGVHDAFNDKRVVSCVETDDICGLPIFEPGLDAIVRARRGKNLFFTTNVTKVIKDCDVLFICVNTPTKTYGVGAGAAADLSAWERAGRLIASVSESSKIVVEKSTVPVRTAEALSQILNANESTGVNFFVLSNPEFLSEGTAIHDLLSPDRVLIGGGMNDTQPPAADILCAMYERWVPKEKILKVNIWSAELGKLIANAYLAQRISSINSVSALCERCGADIQEIGCILGTDTRIGSKFLNASVGFGGSCFTKDLLSLVYICETLGLNEVAEYWHQVVQMNEYQQHRFSRMIVWSLFNTVNGKKIAIFGFSYKKNTRDTRGSPAIQVCRTLMMDGANLSIYDPQVKFKDALDEFERNSIYVSKSNKFGNKEDYGEHIQSPRVQKFKLGDSQRPNAKTNMPVCIDEKMLAFANTPFDAVQDAHAIVIITEWDEFVGYDYRKFYEAMKKPAFIFDGRSILDHSALIEIGFEVRCVGKTVLSKRSATAP